MPKRPAKRLNNLRQLPATGCKPGIVFERLIWPDEVWILTSKDIDDDEISGPPDEPQCLWGHVNNEMRRHLNIPLHEAQLIVSIWYRHFSYVSHILQTKFEELPVLQARRQAILYNAAWATLGYVTNQDEIVLRLCNKSLPTLSKFSPGTVPI